jgi:tetratricopeptide (TPR) repeat protein
VWLALPAASDWRWLRAREDSPWYPSMRLFRQQQWGNWEEVFARIAEALTERAAGARLGPARSEQEWERLKRRGLGLVKEGRLQEAVDCLRRALDVNPNAADVLNNLGVALAELGKPEEALSAFQKVLAIHPDSLDGHGNLGLTYMRQGQLDAAARHFREVIKRKPDAFDVHFNLGRLLRSQDKLAEAAACFQHALQIKPDHAEAYHNLALTYVDLKKPDDAAVNYRHALRVKPDFAEAFNNLGILLEEQGKLDEAIANFRESLRIKPASAETHSNLGVALAGQGRLQEAITCYEESLRLNPNSPDAHNNLGNALRNLGDLAKAMAHYRRALELRPAYAEAYNNMGIAFVQEGKLTEGIASYRRALELNAAYPDAHLNLALGWLAQGDFDKGWPEYEWRWRGKNATPRALPKPPWDGAPLAGRTVLLYAEQGLGDTLQFVRYVPLVQGRGGRVLLECPPGLAPLLSRCPGIDTLVPQGAPLPPFDCHAPLLSLPRLFGTTLASVPATVPYLFADPERIERWRPRLAGPGLRVGIGWQGNPKYRGDRHRSIPLARFAPLAAVPGVRLFSLQKGHGSEQLAEWGEQWGLTDLGRELDEGGAGAFVDTAAVLRQLDVVVTSDTALAHLAGGLGVAVWLALPAASDWRWLRAREDSPWYPSMRLFRQQQWGNWEEVFARIAEALTERVKRSAAPVAEKSVAATDLERRGVALAKDGRLEEAIACFQQAIAVDPNSAESHLNLGVAWARQGKLERAVDSFREAARLEPNAPEAHGNLGLAYLHQHRPAEALACFHRALQLKPGWAETHNNVGVALVELERHDEAVLAYLEALRVKPTYAEAYNNLGNVYRFKDQPDAAIDCFHKCLELKSDLPEVHNNLAIALEDQGKLEEAIAEYEHALRLKPDYPEAHINLSMAWLLQGKFAQGWREYEWRWRGRDLQPRHFPQPLWDGSPLAGRTILLHAEQGLGDTLQFVRYALHVKQRGGTVLLECPASLALLLKGCAGIDRLIPAGSLLPPFDVQAPLLSLPMIFGTTSLNVPARVPYLWADERLVENWRTVLENSGPFKVGIAWQCNPRHDKNRRRAIALEQFAPLAQVNGVRLISLQQHVGTEQLRALAGRFSVFDLGAELDQKSGAFMDTAAVMKNLDLVVTADTAIGHLAGGLGLPVWVALPFTPDWRWLRDREDTPWYPSMRLFRQVKLGDWEGVMARMAAELPRHLAAVSQSQAVTVEISAGELLDRLAILEIKRERLIEPDKLRQVVEELGSLSAARERSIRHPQRIGEQVEQLRQVHRVLWQIEEDLRACERSGDFGPRFVELARSAYRQNDRRAALKTEINQRLEAGVTQQKSYVRYPTGGSSAQEAASTAAGAMARASFADVPEEPGPTESLSRAAPPAQHQARAAICILTYGDYLCYFKRCLESVLSTTPLDQIELRLGFNAAPTSLTYALERLCPRQLTPERSVLSGNIERLSFRSGSMMVHLWSSPVNLFKEPMSRLLYHDVPLASEYAIWFDDDSYVDPGWWPELASVLDQHIDYIGQPWWVFYLPGQADMIKAQPWYRGVPLELHQGKPRVRFMTGGFVAVRSDRLREANFPDTSFTWKGDSLKQYGGDTLLGEIARQLNWTRASYHKCIHVNVGMDGVSRAERREKTGKQFGSDVDVAIS